MDFTDIWNEAYNIFVDPERTDGARYNDMQAFLREQVGAGYITEADKCTMAADIMKTAAL